MSEYELIDFRVETVMASGKVKPRISLNELVKRYPSLIEYKPEKWYCAIFRLISPRSRFIFYDTGKVTINSLDVHGAVKKMKEILKDKFQINFSIEYKVSNVMGHGRLNEGVECGLLRSIFPNSKKAFGEGVRIYLSKKENITIFPSGKIIATGFSSEKMMKEKLNGLVDKINANLQKAEDEKLRYCTIERAEPLIRSYYDYIQKVSEVYRVTFTDAERLLGRTHLEAFLKRKAKEKKNLGATPQTLAAGELYLLSLLTDKGLTQRGIADMTGMTEVSVRKGYKILENTIKDLFEV